MVIEGCERRFVKTFGKKIGKILMRGKMLRGDSVVTLMMAQMVGTYVNTFVTLCFRFTLGRKSSTQIFDMKSCELCVMTACDLELHMTNPELYL